MDNKAQMWFMDFVIGIIIFSLVLITYYTYTTNISKQDTSTADDLVLDAKTVVPSDIYRVIVRDLKLTGLSLVEF